MATNQQQRKPQGGGLIAPAAGIAAADYLIPAGDYGLGAADLGLDATMGELPSLGVESYPGGLTLGDFGGEPLLTETSSLPASSAAEAGAMSTAGYVISAAAALYGTYQLAENWGRMSHQQGAMYGGVAGAGAGALAGAAYGFSYGGPIGAAIGAAVGFLASYITAGKHEDQYKRDEVRKYMVENGMISPDYKLQLADVNQDGVPEYFDIGLDGGAREGYDFSGGRRPHEVKNEHPFSVQAVGWANPLAVILTGGDAKLSSNFAGYFANAAMSNTTDIEGVRANMLQIMKDLKMTRQTAEATLKQMLTDGKIDQMHYDAYMNSVGTLFAGDPKLYVTTPWDEFEAQVDQGRRQVEGDTPAAEPSATAPGAAPEPVTPSASAKIADPSGTGNFHALPEEPTNLAPPPPEAQTATPSAQPGAAPAATQPEALATPGVPPYGGGAGFQSISGWYQRPLPGAPATQEGLVPKTTATVEVAAPAEQANATAGELSGAPVASTGLPSAQVLGDMRNARLQQEAFAKDARRQTVRADAAQQLSSLNPLPMETIENLQQAGMPQKANQRFGFDAVRAALEEARRRQQQYLNRAYY